MKTLLSLPLLVVVATGALAQAPASLSQAPTTEAATGNVTSAATQKLTNAKVDPTSGIVSWDGQHWNITNNALFRARFEKFLNAPQQSDTEFDAYQAILSQIKDLLDPSKLKEGNVELAYGLLGKASQSQLDGNMCSSLADVVHTTWLAQGERDRLKNAEQSARDARKDAEWNAVVGTSDIRPDDKVKTGDAIAQGMRSATQNRDIAEMTGDIATNKLKQEVTIIQAKLEFQSFILQLFTQRRFQHVTIAANFYRNIFGDGDTQLQLSKQAQDALTSGSGLPATIGILQTMAADAERDANEGVQSTIFLLNKNKLNGATEQLQQAFVEGEYMPELRHMPRDQKQRVGDYVAKGNQLLSALDVKDYALAESIVNDMKATAADFDASKPNAAIQTAKVSSSLHLAKAQNAAVAGDQKTFEDELTQAGNIWPTNPDLKTVATGLLKQANVQQKALNDFDALLSQKNYRQIWDSKGKFIAATAQDDTRQKQLNDVLSQVQEIETSITKATELKAHGDSAGAWECVDREAQTYSDDSKLSQLRAQLTTEAADFVHAVMTAKDLESKGQWGSAMAWYLKAQAAYPPSSYAQVGIDGLAKKMLN